jgi:hypothetical protein
LLFVLLPLVLAPLVIWFVARHSPDVPKAYRTSELLLDGEPAQAELLEWKNKGPFLLDSRPMVAFKLRIIGEDVEMSITQSVPKPLLSGLSEGMTLDVRLSPDRTAGAIVLPLHP